MKRYFLLSSAIGVAMLLMMGISVQAAEPAAMPDFTMAPPAASSSGNCLPPACGTAGGATGCSQGDCCGGVHCCCGCGFVGGAEVAFLRPYFNNNAALVGYTLANASVSTTEFAPTYNASPRIWLGYVGECGFGGRISYWEYDQAASAPAGVQSGQDVLYFAPGITSSVPFINLGFMQTEFPGDTLTTSERLHMYTLDAEVTQCLQICCWNFVFGGGLRDASVHIGRESILVPAGAAAPYEDATIDNNFDGIGPTLFTEFRRPFGGCGFAFVGNMRGSLLYGTKSLHVNDVFPTLAQTHTYDQSIDGCLGVAELSLGIEWDRAISCNTTVFAQGLWECQYWDNIGNSISPGGDSLGLSGFTFAVGFAH
jgi:hypothetical protein